MRLQVGDRVKYAAKFLKSIGVYSGDMCFCEGTITTIREYGGGFSIATVDWGGNPEIPTNINVQNLIRVGKLEVCD